MKLMSVVDGKKKYLEEVNDEAFSQKMMGDGIAVVPSVGKVYAPASGRVSMLGFKSYVHVGDVVEEGTLLIEFDVEKIKNAGYETDVMVIITQLSQYSLIHKTEADELTIQDVILDIQ